MSLVSHSWISTKSFSHAAGQRQATVHARFDDRHKHLLVEHGVLQPHLVRLSRAWGAASLSLHDMTTALSTTDQP